MNIGSMNKRISLEAETKVSDLMGGSLVVWKEMASNIACSIWPISATEQIQSLGSTMVVSHRVRMRYRSDIKASWRLKYHHSYFNIVAPINPNMANRMLELLCKEVA